MSNGPVDGGLLGAIGYENKVTCTTQGKAMAIVFAPRPAVNIGVHVFGALLWKAYESLPLEEMAIGLNLHRVHR